MSNYNLTKSDFVTDRWDSYGKTQYRNFRKLTSDQKNKIELLKTRIGKKVKFKVGKKEHVMEIMWVSLFKNDRSTCMNYMSYPYQFRLNYTDGKLRENYGFWSIRIDNLTIID